MSATKLGIWNEALGIIGQRNLASLTETGESRRALDGAWDKSGVTNGGPIYCLEQGYWNFGTRSSALSYSPSVEPPFGYAHAFNKPDDWVRTVSVASDPYFNAPMSAYADEAGFWFASTDIIYVKYISKDASYGLDLSLWPMSFTDFVALFLADNICDRITKSDTKQQEVHKAWKEAKSRANGIDGTNKPTQMLPLGTWAGARSGGLGSANRRER